MKEGQINNLRLLQVQERSESSITNYQEDPHIYNNLAEYIFSVVGLTVGFGSFWRFPYLIYKNGGGVFLIPYTFAIIVVGIPLLYLETAVGQMHRVTIPFIFQKIHPALKMLGMTYLISNLHMASVYNIILTYSYRFIFSSLNPNLPFATEQITQNTYFKETILNQSESIQQFGSINPFLFVIYVCSLLTCHLVIKDGVKESGKLVAYTAAAPFVLLSILVIRAFFLDGAGDGLSYLFTPKWPLLFNFQIWIDAIVQVFYQFSIACGCLVNLSSMKPRRQNFLKGVIIVPISILACGLLSALNIFMYMGHFCKNIGIEINDPSLHLSGPELSFNIFPKALALLPLSNLWILIFFIAMVLLGIDSQFGMMDCIYCYLKDEFKQGPIQIFGLDINLQKSKYILLGIIMIGCPSLTSQAGIYYLQFYDRFICNVPFTLGAIIQLYVFVYLFKFDSLEKQIVKYTGKRTPPIIRFFIESKLLMIILVCNFFMAFIEQLATYKIYDMDFYLFGWFISSYPFILAYWYFRRHWTNFQDMKLTFQQIQHRQSYL